jgi:K+/H+ antiporter YhaU regulatory subunit KhtT
MWPFVTVILILIISLTVTRVAAIILVYTGLSREAARFQARSAFTTTGFTTNESERIVQHPVRRKVVGSLMLLGNAGLVTAMSSLVIGFVGVETETAAWEGVAIIAMGLLAMWIITTNQWLDQRLSRLVEFLLKRFTQLEVRDYAKLLHIQKDYAVTELAVRSGDWVANRTLGELDLPKEGILVLGIDRKNGTYLGLPRSHTKIEVRDILILYGKTENVRKLDQRKSDYTGFRDRAEAEQETHRYMEEQSARENTAPKNPEADENGAQR